MNHILRVFLSPRMAKQKFEKNPDNTSNSYQANFYNSQENQAIPKYNSSQNNTKNPNNRYESDKNNNSTNNTGYGSNNTYEVNISGYITSFNYPSSMQFPQNLAEQIESISKYLELSKKVDFTQIDTAGGFTHSSDQIVHAVLNRAKLKKTQS